MTERFGQLSYTSFDAGDGNPGGWQVKETLGELTPVEVQYLTSRVATQLDTGVELPRFPTAEQIAALPHRLRYAAAAELGVGATATWHTAPAGLDASGRPGNVFAHVVLDRGGPVLSTRPILTWRSPDWLTPYGVAEVLTASLQRPQAPRPGALTAQSVAELIFAPRSGHLAILQVLLDATLAARDGGPPVVLGVADLEDAARWIAAVHLCMSPGTAQRQWFSTLERANQLSDARNLGLELIAVPVSDLDALERVGDIVVLDAGEPVQLGDLDGSPHRTERGDEVIVTPWSVLIAEVLEDADAFVHCTAAIDQLAAEVGDTDLHPAWPIARLVADRPDVEVVQEAHRILENFSPADYHDRFLLRERTGAALRQKINGEVSVAWELARRDSAGILEAELYAELALADPDWLAQSGAGKLPSVISTEPSDAVVNATIRAGAALITAPQHSAIQVRQALHVLEIATAVGAAWHAEANAALVQLSNEVILPGLRDAELCEQVGNLLQQQISDAARGWLWMLLEQHPLPGPPGQRLPPQLIRWLAPRAELAEPDPLIGSPFDDPGSTISPAAEELSWARVVAGPTPPTTRAWAVVSALEYAAQDPGHSLPEGLAELITDWPSAWLQSMHQRFAELVPMEWYLGPLVRSDELGLWQELAHRRDGLISRARLRLADVVWVCQQEPHSLLTNIGRLAEVRHEKRDVAATFDHDLARALAVAILAGQRPNPAWLSALAEPCIQLDPHIVGWAERVPDVTLLWWLLHGAADLNLPHDGPWPGWLGTVRVAGASESLTLVGALLVGRWQQQDPSRSPHAQAAQWRAAAEDAGARIDRATERWLRQWAQQHRTW